MGDVQRRIWSGIHFFAWLVGFITFSARAHALSAVSLTSLTSLADETANTLVKVAALGSAHRPYMPATPLGYLLGVDLGVDVTLIQLPSDFTSTLESLSGSSVSSALPLPRFSIHKGLPWRLDLGFSFMTVPSSTETIYQSYAGSVKWAFIDGVGLPTLAARFSASFNQLFFISSQVYDFDVSISKNFFVIDPYAGMGVQFWNGEIEAPAELSQNLPAGVSLSQAGTTARFFGGVALKLLILKLTTEVGYNTAGMTTVGAKVSLAF